MKAPQESGCPMCGDFGQIAAEIERLQKDNDMYCDRVLKFAERIQKLEAALREKDEIAADYHGFPDDEAEDSPVRCVFLGGSGEACMACRIQALGGDCICGEINARHCPEHNERMGE